MVADAIHSLAGIEIFTGLPGRDLEAVGRACRWRRHAPGEQIVGHQDETNDVYFIADGSVRVIVYSAAGKEIAFRDLHAGKSFGELSAIDGKARSANVIALTDTVLASMTADGFLHMLRDHPEVARSVMEYLVGLVRGLSDRVVEFSVLAVRNRVHAELLRLARNRIDGNAAVIVPAPTHADIASRVSTHREAVTRELNALAREGLVQRDGGALVIRDVKRLEKMVEKVLEE